MLLITKQKWAKISWWHEVHQWKKIHPKLTRSHPLIHKSQSAGISNTTYTKRSEAPICNDKKQRNTCSSYVMSPLHSVIHAVSKLLCFLLTESAKLKADRSLGGNTPPAPNGASAATSCTCSPAAAAAAAVASSRPRRKASSSSSDGHFFIRLSVGSDGHLSLSALLLSWLLLRPRRRPQSTRLLETGDAARQSTEGDEKKGLFGDRKRKETRRGKEGGKVAGCNGVRASGVESRLLYLPGLLSRDIYEFATPRRRRPSCRRTAAVRSVLPCWLRIGEKKKARAAAVAVCPCYGLGVQS